jgi:hypothetical protein
MTTKYIAATLTYGAAMIAIADKAISGGRIELARVSTLQWGAAIVATLSYAVVLLETQRSNKDLREQKLQQAKVRELARTQLRMAIEILLRPYRLFLKDVVSVDDWDRLDSDSVYVLAVLDEPRARLAFRSMDARADANVYPKCKNWELLAERTRSARDLLGQLAAKFVSHLSAEVVEAVEALRTDEMVGMRLPDLDDLMTANKHMAAFTLEQVLGGGPRGYDAFDAMLVRTRALLERIDIEERAA